MIVEFNFYGAKVTIQCKSDEKMKNIYEHYANKIQLDIKKIYFSYDGKAVDQFNEDLTLEDMINSEDKERNKMSILVFSNESTNNDNIIKSKVVICPICGESIRMDMINYKIKLSQCKNNHVIDNMLFDEFEESQKIDITKIKCEICNECNKSISYNNLFYNCITCKKNICPLCQTKHDKLHQIMNYDDKYYICDRHNENYNSYCDDCKRNICTLCEREHKAHKRINLGDIFIGKDELIKQNKELKEYINIFNKNIQIIINIVNEVVEKMNKYYKINEDIINNYDDKKRNYETLYILAKIKNSNIIEEMKNNINDNSIINKFKTIFNMYRDMNINEIDIIYENRNKKKRNANLWKRICKE